MLTDSAKRDFLRLAEEAWDDIVVQCHQKQFEPDAVTLYLDVKVGELGFSGGLQLPTEGSASSRLSRLRSV